MSYETAPATLMLATHCAVCRRPLVDAASVEAGMGPDCRAKHGYDIDVDPDARAEANKLVHAIAVDAAPEMLPIHIAALRVYGFERLADTIVDRRAAVRVSVAGVASGQAVLAVKTPYSQEFVAAFKAKLPWRRWDSARKAWLILDTEGSKRALYAVLRAHFKGALGVGPKGLFTVGG